LLPQLVITDENGYKQLNTIGIVPILTKAVQEQQSQISAISLKTDTNVTSITGLQASVDTQLTVIGSTLTNQATINNQQATRITAQETKTTALEALAGQLRTDVNTQTSRITLLETQMKSLVDFYTAFDLGSLIAKDVSGNIDLTVDKLGNPVLLGGKLKATILETGGLTIEVIDPLAPTIGTEVIYPVAVDVDADGNDDYTGLPMTDPSVMVRDGKFVQVMTKAMVPMTHGSRIFTTFKDNPNGFSWIEKTQDVVKDYVGFKIHLSAPVTAPTKVDWLLVEQK
ncbi:MAG: hypothetical protein WCG73_00060, partial [Candidatus Moraniibacteriota bacterium]